MRRPLVGPAVTRAASILLAVAAAVILAFTALAYREADSHSAQRPTVAPSSPVPVSTMPGSVDSPTGPAVPPRRIPAALKKRWLRGLAGRWIRGDRNNYFRFRADGVGEWIAYRQKLWSGRATPRTATTFDLTDPGGQSAAYWQVKIITGGRRLYFAGTRQVYVRLTRR